jgi:hypothetical protein
MKKNIVSLVIVLVFASIARSQEAKPMSFWSMSEQINNMENIINDMATQLNELRNDFVMYQHFENTSLRFQNAASYAFSVASIHQSAYENTGRQDCYDQYGLYWDLGWIYVEFSSQALEKARVYGERLDIPYDRLGSTAQFQNQQELLDLMQRIKVNKLPPELN